MLHNVFFGIKKKTPLPGNQKGQRGSSRLGDRINQQKAKRSYGAPIVNFGEKS